MAFSTAANTSILTTYLIKKFIPALQAQLVFQKFATPAIIPEGGGKIGRFNVFSNPSGTVAPLTEGTQTGNVITTLTTTGTDCTIAEYGEYLIVNQLEAIAAQTGTRNELANRFAYGGMLALDSLVRAQAKTSTTAFYCSNTLALGGSTSAATPGYGTASSIVGAAQQLRNVGGAGGTAALGFDGVEGHPNGDYAAIVSPKFEATMVTEGTTGRITWAQAVTNVPGVLAQEKVIRGRMGSVYGTTCYRTQNYDTTTLTSSSDNNYILAAGGVGAVSFDDMNPTVIVNDLNSPYKNVDTIAWHAFFGTSLIDSSRVVRMYSNNG